MKAKLIHSGEQKTYALIFEKHDEVIAGLTSFAKQQSLAASHFTAIGAFSDLTLGYFNRDKKDYDKIPVKEQVEALSVMGDIALNKGEPKIHAHIVVGKRDGSTLGGHLVQAHVWPTLEVVLTESPRHLRRKTDEETGLALIELQD